MTDSANDADALRAAFNLKIMAAAKALDRAAAVTHAASMASAAYSRATAGPDGNSAEERERHLAVERLNDRTVRALVDARALIALEIVDNA